MDLGFGGLGFFARAMRADQCALASSQGVLDLGFRGFGFRVQGFWIYGFGVLDLGALDLLRDWLKQRRSHSELPIITGPFF